MIPGLFIERVKPDDWAGLSAVAAIEGETFPGDAQTAPNLALIARAGDVWAACDEHGRLVGEAIILGGVGEPRALLFSLAVVTARRRRGVGLALMNGVIDSLASRGVKILELTVAPANEAALGLYIARLGFERVELMPDHFGPGRPRWLLRKSLTPEGT
ncbi:MAG TPA: N-acetyltransferase [Candidatus Ozemobacteraceae bacterium]|nr:N-acetyltransferase [Candidatus Ozemobacteraceae bacterium]